MPSPFPGMDPFIEAEAWTDFHISFVVQLGKLLVPQVRPKYVVRRERRVYIEHESGSDFPPHVVPDVAVASKQPSDQLEEPTSAAADTAIAPLTLTLPYSETRRETYLTIRERETLEVVCVLEVLSPSNKVKGSDGRREYLSKREAVIKSDAGLVEIDLLLCGQRLPTIEPLPPADYFAFVSRAPERPSVSVYGWSVPRRLPTIPVPLPSPDTDAELNLQHAFETVYDEAGYDYSLSYDTASLPLAPEIVDRIQVILTSTQNTRPNE